MLDAFVSTKFSDPSMAKLHLIFQTVMKKYLFTLVFLFAGLTCNAQIYKSIKYYDKFDDVVKKEQRKTLITKTDSTFIVEEKGMNPVVYYILNTVKEGTRGSKDEIVNLVNNVYGYEETWCVVRSDMIEKYREVYNDFFLDESKVNIEKLYPYWLFIVHRTITTQYTGSFLDEMFWVQDELHDGKLGKDVNRIIYLRD